MHRGHASGGRDGTSEVRIGGGVLLRLLYQLKGLHRLVAGGQPGDLGYRLFAHPVATLGASVENCGRSRGDHEGECRRDGDSAPARTSPTLASRRHIDCAEGISEIRLQIAGRVISIRRVALQEPEDDVTSIAWQSRSERCCRRGRPLNGTDGVNDAPAGKGIGSRHHLAEQHAE